MNKALNSYFPWKDNQPRKEQSFAEITGASFIPVFGPYITFCQPSAWKWATAEQSSNLKTSYSFRLQME